MRLFIAIEFNNKMKDALEDMQRSMRDRGVTGNFTKRANLHLTLAFIGEFDDPDVVVEAIKRAKFRAFDVELKGVGSFGGRLWWAGIDGGKALPAYTGRLRCELGEAGIPFDRKKFSPHITLVRKPEFRGETSEREILEALKNISGVRMRVDHVTLMRSDRGEHGMIYTPVAKLFG